MSSLNSNPFHSESKVNRSQGFLQKEAQRFENNEQLSSNYLKNSQGLMDNPKKRGFPKKRGRPSRIQKSQRSNFTQGEYVSQSKRRKMQVIQAYQNALFKLRSTCTKFYSPFQKHKLNIQKPQKIQKLKQAKEHEINLREAVRSVGIRHQRNLFKYGVRQQITYVINYLERGIIPKWMKEHFEELLDKNFSDTTQTQMHPSLI